jgi:hypothetical protein
MDNVDVPPGCTMTLRVRLEDRFFPDQSTMGGGLGRWMFHCHIFFHHHLGMVSELVVTDANGNERPYVDVIGTSVSVNEGDNASIGGTLFDPDGDAVTFSATLGTVTDHGDGTWTWNYVAEDGPSVQNVYITGTDSEGNKSQAQFSLEVANVAPTLTLDPAQITVIDEGDTLNVIASFSDPGLDEPYTATVDFGTGDGPQAATVVMTSTAQPQTGTITSSLQYGDDGAFPVTVTITDKDGASDAEGFVITVNNVDPTALIENSNPIIAQIGDLVTLDGRVLDPGSDDIDSTWTIDDGSPPDTQLSLLDPPNIDPDPSPSVDPRDVEHDFSRTFDLACAYEGTFSASDDDGGFDSNSVLIVILNEPSKSQNAGYWQHQFKQNGNVDFSVAELECYLEIVTALSSVFDEVTPSTTLADGYDVLWLSGNQGTREKLDRRLMVAWLNVANGGIGFDELIDTDKDNIPDTPFHVILAKAESVRLDPNATESELHTQITILQKIHG